MPSELDDFEIDEDLVQKLLEDEIGSTMSLDDTIEITETEEEIETMQEASYEPFILGSAIDKGDENCIILAARNSDHGGLPLGNKHYEDTIDEVIEEKNVSKVSATPIHEVLRRMGVVKKANSFTSTRTFFAIRSGKPGKDWEEKEFMRVTEYQVLVYKTKRTMETRLKRATGGDSTPEAIRSESLSSRPGLGAPQNKKKRTAPEDQMPAPQYQVPENDEFKSSLKQVRSCEAIEDFIEMYEAGIVYDCLDRIRSARYASGQAVEAWAEQWAKSLCQGDEGAKALNKDRKLGLELLYTLWKRWKGEKGPQTLSAENIVNDFGERRIMGILMLCLPMDRASSLHNMTVADESRPGTHWVSEIHVARDPEWKARMSNYNGFPTMNKCFIWLM